MKVFLIVLIAFVSLTLIFLILIYFTSISIRNKILNIRYDDNGTLHYFSVDDYPSLQKRKVEFLSGKLKLKGYFYQKEITKDNLIVLAHGLGAGHNQYMEEINYFTSLGYEVFTYDVRGCNESEGKGIKFFSNALLDLNAALNYLENNDEYKEKKVLLYGHSMGGYCVNNIINFDHKNILGIVSLSSFNSPSSLLGDMMMSFLGKNGRAFKYSFAIQEFFYNPKVSKYSSIKSLANTDIPVLLISGDKDNVVNVKNNYELYKEKLADKKNISFLLVKGRYHRANISLSAAKYDQEVGLAINEFTHKYKGEIPADESKALYDSFDYYKLVEFDKEVMEQISNFYQKIENNEK